MAIDINKLRLLSTRLNTNIDNLNKNKKFMHIPQKIMDEFVDIYIDLENMNIEVDGYYNETIEVNLGNSDQQTMFDLNEVV